jgi:hypothetical protein
MKRAILFLLLAVVSIVFVGPASSTAQDKQPTTVKALDLGDFTFVVGHKYLGDEMMTVIDKHFPSAVFSPDETIRFKHKGKNYTMKTEKVTFSGPAYYKIVWIRVTP